MMRFPISRLGLPIGRRGAPGSAKSAIGKWQSASAIIWLVAVQALAAGNLVKNGGFEQGEGQPALWHVRLTDFMPKKEVNAQNFISHRYICACGKDFGSVKPWCGLICPNCRGFFSGEECGDWYVSNHERVSLDKGLQGRAVKFTLPTDVGNNQGVRILSHLIKAKPGWGYKLSFAARARGSHPRVFVEGFRYLQRTASPVEWDGSADPGAPQQPIERCFRAHVNCEGADSWKTYTKDFVPPKRYTFDYMTVKLYAYMPGEAWFDNVSLRPMTASEMREWLSGKREPKDKRFER